MVAFENDSDRFVPEWGELLELGPIAPAAVRLRRAGALRRRARRRGAPAARRPPAPGRLRPDLLRRRRARLSVPLSRAGRTQRDPLAPGSGRRRSRPSRGGSRRTSPSTGCALLDEAALRCAYRDGLEPYVLHHYLDKPWIEPMYHGIYSQLLARCLLGPGLAIRVDEREVPLRFREGALARLERARVGIPDLVGWKLGACCRTRSLGGSTSAGVAARPPDERRLLLGQRPGLLPGVGRARQLAAPARPPPAGLRPRLRHDFVPARAARPRGDDRGRSRRRRAEPAEARRPARPPSRDDGPARRRHHRHAPARRADRDGRRGPARRLREREPALLLRVGRAARASAMSARGPT